MIPKKIYIRELDIDIFDQEVNLTRAWVANKPCTGRREYTDLSQVWHSNQEMPQQDIDEYGSGKDCLVEIRNSSLIEIGQALFDDGIYAFSCHLNTYAMDEIKRWAYIDDLLLKGGENGGC